MYTSGVRIGSIQLAEFEIPSTIHFGGAQRVAVHRLSRGGRAIELLGPDESDIWFRGVFSGPDAETRMRELNALRKAGTTVPFEWQSFRYDVIVRTLRATYTNPWWIAFAVGLLVIQDDVEQIDPGRSRVAVVQADLKSARDYLVPWPADLDVLLQSQMVQDACVPGSTASLQITTLLTRSLFQISEAVTDAERAIEPTRAEPDEVTLDPAVVSSQLLAAGRLAALASGRAYLRHIQALLTGDTL